MEEQGNKRSSVVSHDYEGRQVKYTDSPPEIPQTTSDMSQRAVKWQLPAMSVTWVSCLGQPVICEVGDALEPLSACYFAGQIRPELKSNPVEVKTHYTAHL